MAKAASRAAVVVPGAGGAFVVCRERRDEGRGHIGREPVDAHLQVADERVGFAGSHHERAEQVGIADQLRGFARRDDTPLVVRSPAREAGEAHQPLQSGVARDAPQHVVEGQRSRPSWDLRFDLLNEVGSSPARRARPDGES